MQRHSISVRVVVPRRGKDGQIDYRVETRTIRLPLRREDREDLVARLTDR